MWVVRFLLVLTLSVSSALAQPNRPNGYQEAAQSFEQRSPDLRVRMQVYLTAAGFWPAVPNEQFSGRLFKAIQDFQSANGLVPSGILGAPEIEKLADASVPNFIAWGFQLVRHPERGRPIWIPLGLGLVPERKKEGYHYTEPKRRLSFEYTYFPYVSVKDAFDVSIAIAEKNNRKIYFKILRQDFFVISSSDGPYDRYMRYHRDGNGILGIDIIWNNANGNVFGERIATLASGSLWAAMTGARFPEIPGSANANVEVSKTPQPSVPPSAPASPPAAKTPPKNNKGGSGTGFFVSANGHIVTNNHVVDGCSTITVQTDDRKSFTAQLIGHDAKNDLALLRVEMQSPKFAPLRIGARLGEPVAAFGYPLAELLASSGNFTLGNITALAGIGDDTRFVQTSTPVQPGNSGGPLLDHSGGLVGVVTAKLNAVVTAAATGDIPQNVNFAVKASILASFLESNRQSPSIAATSEPMSPIALADFAKSVSVFVLCK